MPRGKPCEFTLLQQDAIAAAVNLGWSERAIAAYVGKPRTNVQRYIRRLRSRPVTPESLEIMLPVNVLMPKPRCPRGHVQDGDPVYCAECDRTGIDDHPLLQRDPRTDPKPEPAPPPPPAPKPLTRREKRKLLAASRKTTIDPKRVKVTA